MAGAALFVAVAGLANLEAREVWFDEAASFRLADVGGWSTSAKDGGNMVAYYGLLRGLMGVSMEAWWLRLPSVIFTTAAVFMIYLLGRRLYDERVGVVSSVLLAASIPVVFQSVEARSYALLLLVTLAAIHRTVVWLDRRRATDELLVIILLILMGYVHIIAALIVPAFILIIWFDRDPSRPPIRELRVTAATIAGLLPIAWWALNAWTEQISNIPTGAGAAVRTVVFVLGAGYQRGVALAVVAIYGLLWLGIITRRFRSGVRRVLDTPLASDRIVLIWVVLPLVTAIVISLNISLLRGRYFTPLIPGVIIGAGAYLDSLRSRKSAAVVLAVLVVVGTSLGVAGIDNSLQKPASFVSSIAALIDDDDIVTAADVRSTVDLIYHLEALRPGTLLFDSPLDPGFPSAEGLGAVTRAPLQVPPGASVWLFSKTHLRGDRDALLRLLPDGYIEVETHSAEPSFITYRFSPS